MAREGSHCRARGTLARRDGAEGTGGRRQGALWSYGVRLLWFDKEPEILAGSIDKGVAKRASNRVKCGSQRRVKT